MASSGKTKLLLRPLLKRRHDLAFSGRTLFFTPVTHYLRGVEFLSSRWHDAPHGVSFAQQLSSGTLWVMFSGHRNEQYEFGLNRDWHKDEDRASRDLCEIMERHALPPVEPIVNFPEHRKRRAYICGERGSPLFTLNAALGLCAQGDFDRAEKIAARCLKPGPWRYEFSAEQATDEIRYSEDLRWRLPYLLRTLQTDRSKVIPLLHDWEAFSVKNFGLTKYWKPTPFPCEL